MKKFFIRYSLDGKFSAEIVDADSHGEARERFNCWYPDRYIDSIKEIN